LNIASIAILIVNGRLEKRRSNFQVSNSTNQEAEAILNLEEQYSHLVDHIEYLGLDIDQIINALKNQKIETPSWGYANSGTRFKNFPWPGAARSTKEKIDDAAMVHKMTGIAPSIAIHLPWDIPKDGDFLGMCQYAEAKGLNIGAVNPNVFQNDEYRLGSIGNPNPVFRELALDHIKECCEIMPLVKSDILSLWFADGTNYAGQDNLRARKQRFEVGLTQIYHHLPDGARMLIEYKFFEPSFYSTDIPDWGTAFLFSQKLGEKAQVLIDLGHHASGVNIEQIVSFLLDEGKLGGFHFNNRKYADDDLIVGSVNPFELFLIYNEITTATLSEEDPLKTTAENIAYMIDQSHNIEGKLAPMILSVINCQEAFAKSLLIQRKLLREKQLMGDVLGGYNLLREAFQTDVRPLLAKVRQEMDNPIDPITAYASSGYEEKIVAERGTAKSLGGYQG
jgi:L-rhamnose isomerase/sugar isomerase